MGKNVAQKILESHLAEGDLQPGSEIGIRIDQTLTQDATGTMVFLQFEAMGIPRVQTKKSVSYIDHNVYQFHFRNSDDHRFLQAAAQKYGVYFSKAGNGICHQVHQERFATPGQTLLGSDSHTPTCGGLGMIAIGAGGLDIAVAMAGGPYYLTLPEIVRVELTGTLPPWSTAKDVILELLRRLTVKGGVGKLFEFAGPGVATLNGPERCTITNMGTELGATTSVFPSDEVTRDYMARLGREPDWQEFLPDSDASYDETIELDLSQVEPLIAKPSMPDNVVPVREAEGGKIHQIIIGSCTNGAYTDILAVAQILKGKTIHPDVSMIVAPASKQALEMIAQDGLIQVLMAAGVDISEATCGACIGVGHVPASDSMSLRTFNRNFRGRSGQPEDQVYLCSPEVAAASALRGEIADPRSLGEAPVIELPATFTGSDLGIIPPSEDGDQTLLVKGPNIKEVPLRDPLENRIEGEVLLKVGDDITTDHIMPARADILSLRSNIPAISEYAFSRIDESFPARAREMGGGFVVGGENYGQGSSREHAALAPMFLGVKAVLASSFARIHRSNLLNYGILPLVLEDAKGYEAVDQGDRLAIDDLRQAVSEGKPILVENQTKGTTIQTLCRLTTREQKVLLAGGLLPFTKQRD